MDYYNNQKGNNNINCQGDNITINENQETLNQILTYLEGLQKEVISLKNTVSELNERINNCHPTGPVIPETMQVVRLMTCYPGDDPSTVVSKTLPILEKILHTGPVIPETIQVVRLMTCYPGDDPSTVAG